VSGSAQRLAAEHDDTFRLVDRTGTAVLLKISVARERSGTLVSFPTAVLLHLAATAPALPVQRPVAALDGAPEVRIGGGDGAARLVRMTSWLASAGPAGHRGPPQARPAVPRRRYHAACP
jgi:hydroxylysine kinase